MAIAEVGSRDLDHLPEQAELELDQHRCLETGRTGWSHCEHGERSCRNMGNQVYVRHKTADEFQFGKMISGVRIKSKHDRLL